MKQLLSIENLSFLYQQKTILSDLSMQLNEGEIVTLIGRSGSGKTTLFKLLTHILTPTSGKIFLMGKEVKSCLGHTGYMTQEELLLPWRTVLKNITLCAELGKLPTYSPACDRRALELLEKVNMKHCADMYPHQLSGGMRQRVSLARSLFQQKPLLFLDEPFAALDVSLREQMYVMLREIRASYKTTILLVTHDFRDAITLSDRVFLLSNGQIAKEWILSESLKADPYATSEILKEMSTCLKF